MDEKIEIAFDVLSGNILFLFMSCIHLSILRSILFIFLWYPSPQCLLHFMQLLICPIMISSEDIELDNEPTLFEQVMTANMDDESDDDDEDDEDEAEERHVISDEEDD